MPDLRLVVPKALSGARLDRVLDELVEGQTRSQLQKLVRRGRVRIDGKRVVRSNIHVAGRCEIEIELEETEDMRPPFQVLHEEASFLIVVKESGVLTHRADRTKDPSLADMLEVRFGPLPRLFGEERPGIVHRLDRETSGLLVIGRSDDAMHALKRAFAERTVKKSYLALVHNVLRDGDAEMELTDPIGPVPGKADRQQVRPRIGGKSARTLVKEDSAFGQHALFECSPHTGRRHQIRVHLAEQGFPVVKDPLYGTRNRKPLPAGVPEPPRLALHAAGLNFPHPETGERVAFQAPLPDDLRHTVDALRRAFP